MKLIGRTDAVQFQHRTDSRFHLPSILSCKTSKHQTYFQLIPSYSATASRGFSFNGERKASAFPQSHAQSPAAGR